MKQRTKNKINKKNKVTKKKKLIKKIFKKIMEKKQ